MEQAAESEELEEAPSAEERQLRHKQLARALDSLIEQHLDERDKINLCYYLNEFETNSCDLSELLANLLQNLLIKLPSPLIKYKLLRLIKQLYVDPHETHFAENGSVSLVDEPFDGPILTNGHAQPARWRSQQQDCNKRQLDRRLFEAMTRRYLLASNCMLAEQETLGGRPSLASAIEARKWRRQRRAAELRQQHQSAHSDQMRNLGSTKGLAALKSTPSHRQQQHSIEIDSGKSSKLEDQQMHQRQEPGLPEYLRYQANTSSNGSQHLEEEGDSSDPLAGRLLDAPEAWASSLATATPVAATTRGFPMPPRHGQLTFASCGPLSCDRLGSMPELSSTYHYGRRFLEDPAWHHHQLLATDRQRQLTMPASQQASWRRQQEWQLDGRADRNLWWAQGERFDPPAGSDLDLSQAEPVSPPRALAGPSWLIAHNKRNQCLQNNNNNNNNLSCSDSSALSQTPPISLLDAYSTPVGHNNGLNLVGTMQTPATNLALGPPPPQVTHQSSCQYFEPQGRAIETPQADQSCPQCQSYRPADRWAITRSNCSTAAGWPQPVGHWQQKVVASSLPASPVSARRLARRPNEFGQQFWPSVGWATEPVGRPFYHHQQQPDQQSGYNKLQSELAGRRARRHRRHPEANQRRLIQSKDYHCQQERNHLQEADKMAACDGADNYVDDEEDDSDCISLVAAPAALPSSVAEQMKEQASSFVQHFGSSNKSRRFGAASPNCRPNQREKAKQGLKVRRTLRVEVKKTKPILGIAIEGGYNVSGQLLPRIVCVHEDGAAYQCGQLRASDLILQVNGISTVNMSHDEIAKTIANAYYQDPRPYIEFLIGESSHI